MMQIRRPLPLFLLLLMALAAAAGHSQDRGLQAQKALTVVSDDNYPPYAFRSADGRLQGILPDQWSLWSGITGVPVNLRGEEWSAALSAMETGGADVLETAFLTREREAIWDFSSPYATIAVPVYTSDSVTGVNNLASLEGFQIGVKAGDACIEKFEAAGIESLKLYPSYEAIVQDAMAGNIHVFCVDEPPALYYMSKFGVTGRFKEAFVLYSGQFRRAVRKGDDATLALVDAGFAKMSPARLREIDRKWMGKKLADGASAGTLAMAALIAAACIAALGILILYLRTVVKSRTAQLRESEKAAGALLDANPDLLFIFDETGKVLQFKPSALMPLYAEPGAFLGKSVRETLPPALADRTVSAIIRVLSSGEPESIEYSLDMDGGPRSYEARLSRMGERRVLSIIRDITERKELEEQTIRGHKLESIGVFAGGIAHDFNNILTAIEGNIALARAYPGIPDACSAFLANAERSADRASALTSQLLAFAKGGSPVRSTISLAAVARETAALALAGSSCALKAEIDEDPFYALADRNQIAQALNNIVLNACQAMPGGGAVGLRLSRARLKPGNRLALHPGEYVSIEISDSGPGIPRENLKRVFDPYFSTKPGSSGLGLSVSHSIVKRHGGGIELSSRPGRGTVFTVFIPAAEGAEAAPAPRAPEAARQRKPLRALVMDDEESVRQFLDELLKDMDLPHEMAENGERGLELFEAARAEGRPFDLVFADLTVPGGMGGMDMMRQMRLSGQEFKSVVISGYSNDPIMSNYRANGFDACLMKPFKIQDFKSTVERLSGGS